MLSVSSDCERKATFDFWVGSLVVRVFEMTRRQHRFLRIIEGNGEEAIPVIHKILLGNDLMQSYPALKVGDQYAKRDRLIGEQHLHLAACQWAHG